MFLTAATKFLFAPLAGYYLGMSLKTTLVVTTLGGLTGIFLSSVLGAMIRKYWRSFFCLFLAPFSKQSYRELVNTPPRRFSRMNRLIAHVRRKFGLAGLAFITPLLISIPAGMIIAMNIYSRKGRVIAAMIISLLFWSLTLNFATPALMKYLAENSTGF